MSSSLKDQYASSPLYGSNAPAVEALYEQYIRNPDSVAEGWRRYFRTLGDGHAEVAHEPIRERLVERTRRPRTNGSRVASKSAAPVAAGEKQAAVARLIQIYHLRGHQIADIDPLGIMERHTPGVLKLDYLGLSEADMDTEFFTGNLAGTGNRRMKLRDILDLLKKMYCGKIGVEFAHVSRARERLWLRKHFEKGVVSSGFPDEDRLWLLEQLVAAEGIERYLHTRFVGQKRFSLEGGDSLIPMLDDLIQQGGIAGANEIWPWHSIRHISRSSTRSSKDRCAHASNAGAIWIVRK